MPYSIMIDAGHGGDKDPGAVYNGRKEKDDNLRLALAVGQILQNNGLDIEYTRTTDVYETPYEKALKANNAGADLFLSIHRNSFPTDNKVSGVETLVYSLNGLKYEMAQNIDDQLERVGFKNLGVKARPNLVVLKRTNMPALLVEAGFLNSNADNALFDQNFDAIAQAIATGVLETLGTEGVIKEELYHIQVGAFRNRTYAERLLNELLEQDYPAYIDDSSQFYRVQVGSYENLNDAVEMERRLKKDGYSTVVIK